VNGNRRLTARDYKGAQRSSFDFGRWKEFAAGLGVGLLAAVTIYVSDHRSTPPTEVAAPSPRQTPQPAGTPESTAATEDTDYAFYDMLPKFEVVVPEKERSARVDSASRIERPGTYFLQVGSYRNQDEAERVKAQLARQDIVATVQRIAVDADVWHRVRVGPIKDLGQLNRLRQQLQKSDRDTLVIRVEE
jgi:cell division protein FtsN